MKSKLIVLAISFMGCAVLAQTQEGFPSGGQNPSTGGTTNAQPVPGDISTRTATAISIERDANHEVLLSVAVKTNSNGALTKTTNTTTVLGSGLFYKDEKNLWVRSAPSIAISQEGNAESRGTHHQVTFLPNVAVLQQAQCT